MPRLQRRSGARAVHLAQAGRAALSPGEHIGDWQIGWGVPGGLTVALLVGALLFALAVLGSRPSAATPLRRAALVALRWLSALAIFVLATQPSFWGERVKRSEGVRAVVLDVSRSMGVRVEGQSRLEQARALLERWGTSTAGRDARYYILADQLEPRAREASLSAAPMGMRSVLVDSIAQLVEQEPDLGAVVLISDGRDTTGSAPVSTLDVAVHTVAVPDARPLRDDSIAELHADPVAFLHGEGRVQLTLRSVGLGDRTLGVLLSRGDEPIERREVHVSEGGEASLEMPFTPRELGREVYTLRLEHDGEDDVPENDSRSFLVRVTRERLRVLHVSGRPSWDQRFLRGFLKRDPSVDLVSFFILRSVHDLTMSPSSELALIPFPTDELFRQHLTSFDLLVLQDFDYEPYQMASYLPLVREYVLQGGGLAMIGGTLSFDGGGYAETPLADVLPVKMAPTRAEGAQIVAGDFTPEPVAELLHHPILALEVDSAASVAAIRQAEKLSGANRLLGLRQGAYSLLEHPRERAPSGAKMPLLAVGSFGKGRSLALGTDTIWHWGMPTAGKGGDPSTYDRFWDRVVRWLTHDPLLEPARVASDETSYPPGASVGLSGFFRDPSYRPLADAEVSVVLRSLLGGELSRFAARTDYAGALSLSFSAPEEAGAYEVRIEQGAELLAKTPFLVELGGEELRDPRLDPDTLTQLARASGGRFFASPDAAPALSELDATRSESLGVERIALFGEPRWVALLLAAICLEWWLRRRWGET